MEPGQTSQHRTGPTPHGKKTAPGWAVLDPLTLSRLLRCRGAHVKPPGEQLPRLLDLTCRIPGRRLEPPSRWPSGPGAFQHAQTARVQPQPAAAGRLKMPFLIIFWISAFFLKRRGGVGNSTTVRAFSCIRNWGWLHQLCQASRTWRNQSSHCVP